DSRTAIGIDLKAHDVRCVEDDWESPTLGATGLGWEVWLDGMEVTQFTYFQQVGGIELYPVSVELTYGLERIAMFLQDVDNVYDLAYNKMFRYRDIFHQAEREFSQYSFEVADVKMHFETFDQFEKEAGQCLLKGLVRPAYDYVLKCSHAFNILDARKAISVNERVGYIARIRKLAIQCAEKYCKGFESEKKEKKVKSK
ncbi:glycine--tRNA ligase subunit alpha, partial [PVC group bacterium]|nr:glycine--tRNA ligase subunit alpha [PVC group bacterium]